MDDVDDPITPFEPCAIYYPDADQTEMLLRDAGIVWTRERARVELGYDMQTGELIAVRLEGNKTKRAKPMEP